MLLLPILLYIKQQNEDRERERERKRARAIEVAIFLSALASENTFSTYCFKIALFHWACASAESRNKNISSKWTGKNKTGKPHMNSAHCNYVRENKAFDSYDSPVYVHYVGFVSILLDLTKYILENKMPPIKTSLVVAIIGTA